MVQEKMEKVNAGGIEKLKNGIPHDDVFERIKEMMSHNQLIPGQKIIYQDLATKLNTSITPVVQALKRLESYKIVQYSPNKGYMVTEITEGELRELYEAREALEIFLLPRIIKNITPEGIASIRDYFRKQDTLSPNNWILHDWQFHLKITAYARHEVIYHLLDEIIERTHLRYRPQYLGEQRLRDTFKEHREILNSLVSGNLKEARNAVRNHIHHQLDYTIEHILRL